MSESKEPIPFNDTQGIAAETKVPDAEGIQGITAFYSGIKVSQQSIFETAAPFLKDSPQINNYLTEAMRCLELASMYADRLAFVISNPALMTEGKPADA